jgi:hypothetical protein
MIEKQLDKIYIESNTLKGRNTACCHGPNVTHSMLPKPSPTFGAKRRSEAAVAARFACFVVAFTYNWLAHASEDPDHDAQPRIHGPHVPQCARIDPGSKNR